MTTAAVLEILVKAETAQAQASLTRMDRSVRRTADNTTHLTRATSRVGSALKGAAISAASAAVAYLSIAQAKEAIHTTEDLAKATKILNTTLGLSIETGSEWLSVAKAWGVDSKKVGMAFKTLSTQVTSAKNGSETAMNSFKELGISVKDLGELSKHPQQLLLQLSDGLEGAKGSTDKLTAAGKLLGKGYQTLLPMLGEGSKALKEQLGWAKEYGATLDGKTIKSITDLHKAQIKSNLAFQGLQIMFTEQVAPALVKVVSGFADFIKTIRHSKRTVDDIKDVLKVLGIVVRVLMKVWTVAMNIMVKDIRALLKAVRWTSTAVTNAFKWMKNAGNNLADAFKNVTGDIGHFFSSMGHTVVNIINWIIDKVNQALRLLGALKDAVPHVGLGGAPSAGAQKIFGTQGTAVGGGQRGMMVKGFGTGDRVKALLEPGEVVVNKRAVAAMGGPERVNQINSAIPRFAKGGMVGPVHVGGSGAAGAIGQGAANIVRAAANRYIKKHSGGDLASVSNIVTLGHMLEKMGYQVGENPAFGGVTPGAHVPGSLHYSGRAIDVNHDQGQEAKYLDQIYGPLSKNKNVTELLWRVAGHFDHEHVGMQKGGMVRGTHWLHPKVHGHFTADEAATLLWQIGAKMSEAQALPQVLPGESGGSISADNPSSSAIGLYQILQSVHGGQIARALQRFGAKNIRDPRANSWVALDIMRTEGFPGPWEGGISGPKGKVHPGWIGGPGGSEEEKGPKPLTGIQKMLLKAYRLEHGKLRGPAGKAARVAVEKARRALRAARGPLNRAKALRAYAGALGTQKRLGKLQGAYNKAKKTDPLRDDFATIGRLVGLERRLTGSAATSVTAADDSGLVDLLREQLLLSQQRYAVSQAQYGVLSSFPFGGNFGSGGVVPGPQGVPRAIVAHGGETVGGPPLSIEALNIHSDGTVTMQHQGREFEIAVKRVTRKQARHGARRLPGQAGVLH